MATQLNEYIPTVELWTFIYNKLNGFISCDIYDYVPDEESFPYVVFGEETVTPERTKQNCTHRVVTYFHIYSDSKGRKEATELSNEILEILTNRNQIWRQKFSGSEHGVYISGLADNGFSSVEEVDSESNIKYRHAILGIEWLIF